MHFSIWLESVEGSKLFGSSPSFSEPLERVRKSEGIAFDPLNQRRYIVSDLDCELYIHQLHDNNEAATNFDDGC